MRNDRPFAHKATWLAAVLTPFARYAYAGCTPFFLIDTNVPASGKGLLADCTILIATGRTAARMTVPRDDDEARKRIIDGKYFDCADVGRGVKRWLVRDVGSAGAAGLAGLIPVGKKSGSDNGEAERVESAPRRGGTTPAAPARVSARKRLLARRESE